MHSLEYSRCRRKRRHVDYLSALKHAATLDRSETVVVYPCRYCGGLHVGHQSGALKARRENRDMVVDPLSTGIAKTKRKIKRVLADLARGLRNQRKSSRRQQQRLRDLRKHLAFLELKLENRKDVIQLLRQ